MTTVTNPYDALYTNLKNRFTVINNGEECSVADYMLMKAGKAKAASSLPAEIKRGSLETSMSAFVSFMSEKLTVKNPPIKDRTLRRFPVKSAFSAMLSAVAVCALVISCGIFASSKTEDNVITNTQSITVETEEEAEITPTAIPEK